MWRRNGWSTLLLGWLALTCAVPTHANPQTANVVLSNDKCGYILLDTGDGQALVKMQKGEFPRPGDRLRGTLRIRDFADLRNSRTGDTISVWVDVVERSTTRALTRYGRHCH